MWPCFIQISLGESGESVATEMRSKGVLATQNNWEMRAGLNGLVHPKMKMKSLITHPHAVPTP